jgi:exodeoxyribonuclease VII small subunit
MTEREAALSFEDAVLQLEQIVGALEAGTLPLDESLRRFEEAVALSRQCAEQLTAAEKQISVLTGGGLRPAPEFAAADASE